MAADHFCLIWNNFQNSILSALGNLQSSQDLVDVTLMCEGRNVRAHKVILSACSPYFRNLFKETPCQHPVIILKDVTHYDLTALLQFMYQGEVMVTQDCLASFLKTAELLQISGLAGTAAAASSGIDPIESVPRAPPDPVGNPPDSPGTAINKINSDLSLTKHKRSEKVEKEPTESTTMAPFTETDPQQSCSYQQPAPIIIKTESVDREYDDMDTDPAELKNATDDSFDNSTAHGDEPSILERSLKAQSGLGYQDPMQLSLPRLRRNWEWLPQVYYKETKGNHYPRKEDNWRRCKHCSRFSVLKQKRTKFVCTVCNVPLCIDPCFTAYHKQQ